MNNNYLQIKDKLAIYPIEQLAKSTHFQKRPPKKITAEDFIISAFQCIRSGQLSAQAMAESLSWDSSVPVSTKAIDNKLSYRHEGFITEFLKAVLQSQLTKGLKFTPDCFSDFDKVSIYDSSCLKLPTNLADDFPGPHSKAGLCATARIQLELDVLNQQYSTIELQSYRDNDQKQAHQIAQRAEPNQLLIFDLGYAVLAALEVIANREAFF